MLRKIAILFSPIEILPHIKRVENGYYFCNTSEEMSLSTNEYVGHVSWFSPKEVQALHTRKARLKEIPAISIYLAHYKAFPCLLQCKHPESNAFLHVQSILNYFETELGHNPRNDIICQKYHRKSRQFFANSRLCHIGNGIMVYFSKANVKFNVENPQKLSADFSDEYFVVSRAISIYYVPEQNETVQNMAKQLMEFSIFESEYLQLNMVWGQRCSGYFLTNILIKKPMITDLALHYGKCFVHLHEKILKACNTKDGKGIVLLHGMPGTGKTNYIRYLIAEIQEKKLIYIPPDSAKDISKPEFLTFLLQHQNSVLIIEDAENILRDRNETLPNMSQAVANLLNLSDGLLGDAIHMQIIATFNCDLTHVDKALLRTGRLIAEYEFQKLDVENAKLLSNKLGFGMEHISTPMTLAEIYNPQEENDAEIIVKISFVIIDE